MSELPKCKICGNYPVNYHTGAFGVKHHCDNKHCTLNNVLFTSEQWRALMGEPEIEASPEPESAEPVAYMRLHSTGLYIKMEHLSETQAKRNHYQSLERLNERGGITPAEALALIEKRSYRTIGEFEATKKLLGLVSEITKPQPPQE